MSLSSDGAAKGTLQPAARMDVERTMERVAALEAEVADLKEMLAGVVDWIQGRELTSTLEAKHHEMVGRIRTRARRRALGGIA